MSVHGFALVSLFYFTFFVIELFLKTSKRLKHSSMLCSSFRNKALI